MILPSRSLMVTMSTKLARSARRRLSDALCLEATSASRVMAAFLVFLGDLEGGDPAVGERALVGVRLSRCLRNAQHLGETAAKEVKDYLYEIGRARGTHRRVFFTECSHLVICPYYSGAELIPAPKA